MFFLFSKYYYGLVLRSPGITLLVVVFFSYHTPSFRLDASADSLVLENDEMLEYYRSIRARYLKTLVSKMALEYGEIIDSGLNEKSRGKLIHLDIGRERDGSFVCGDNPFAAARVIEE